MSEYGKQIKAFFHFMFKHLFEIEFGFRVVVEIIIFVVLVCVLLEISNIIISKIVIGFIYWELIMQLHVRLFEKIAFSTSNPNWQYRANKIKDAFRKNKERHGSKNNKNNSNNNKKNYVICCFFIYIVLVAWICGFHYYGEGKRNSYGAFFLGEDVILAIEDLTINVWFNTEEHAIKCFFHNKIETD